MVMVGNKVPVLIRVYKFCWKSLEKFSNLLNACIIGFWLGILDHEDLHWIDQQYYNDERMYHDEHYNRRGLFSWEREVIDTYFTSCKSILLIGAGGGREVLA